MKIWGSRILGRENIKCKGFETDKRLLGASKGKSLIAGAQWHGSEWHEVRPEG